MLRFPRRSLTTFAAFTLLSSFSFLTIYACLPDLPTLPNPQDASEATTPDPIPFFGCGDSIIDTLDDGGVTSETCDPGDASVAGCESCKFVCSGRISDAGHCYFFADSTQKYSEALTACANAAGHVVTFGDDREVAFVNDLVATTRDGGSYWVGLSIRSDLDLNYGPPSELLEPGFPAQPSIMCPGCFALADAGKFEVEPTLGTGSYLIASQERWLQAPTTLPSPILTVCEREPVGQRLYYCGGPNCTTLTTTAGIKRYVLPQALVTEDQAVAACSAYGKLVVLDSAAEREQLVGELTNQFALKSGKPIEVWIGLSMIDGGTWDDGKERPIPWAVGEPGPGSTRAYLQISERRFDNQLARTSSDAGAVRAVVCERPPPP
jgi:hypothetical protein